MSLAPLNCESTMGAFFFIQIIKEGINKTNSCCQFSLVYLRTLLRCQENEMFCTTEGIVGNSRELPLFGCSKWTRINCFLNRKDSEKWDAIETQLHVSSFYRIILICTAQSQTDWGGTHSNWSAKATVKYAILCPCRS